MTFKGIISVSIVLMVMVAIVAAMVASIIRLYREGKRFECSIKQKYSGQSAW